MTAALIFIIPPCPACMVAMALMGAASFCSDLTMPISWNTCVEIGKQYTATVSSTMNMLGNFAGFVAPVVFGMILQDHRQLCHRDVHHGGGGDRFGQLLAVPGAGPGAPNFQTRL